jgi:hypothetical protein
MDAMEDGLMKKVLLLLAVIAWTAPVAPLGADEGMWLFNRPPRRLVKEKYGFDLTDAWLEKLQRSTVQLSSGGSGAFVSPDGLVLTAHHVVAPMLQLLPPRYKDVVKDGFCGAGRAQEIVLPGLTLEVVWDIVDVTAQVRASVEPNMTLSQAKKARDATMDRIEEESEQRTELISAVVSFNDCGTYHLFRSKTYNDVRLVFLPEQANSAGFDVCFVRAYENGKPARVPYFLPLTATRPQKGELVLVAGIPGETSRSRTAVHLEATYGPRYYLDFKFQARTLAAVERFASQSPDHARRAQGELATLRESVDQSLSFLGVMEQSLAAKRAEERAFRARLAQHPTLAKRYQAAENQIAAALRERDRLDPAYAFLVEGWAFGSSFYHIAEAVLYLADDESRPVSARVPPPGAQASWKDAKQSLAAAWHIDRELDIVKLGESLSMWAERMGEDELLTRVLAGKSPQERARELVQGTRLDDVANRNALAEWGKKGIAASADPMIALARLVAGRARQIERECLEQVALPLEHAYDELQQIRSQVDGERYPDANDTLRLAYGRATDLQEAGSKGSFLKLVSHIFGMRDLDPPPLHYFSYSADGVGGNSGGPVVNRRGQVLGVTVTSSNRAGALSYVEGDSQLTAVAASGILAGLERNYNAHELLQEIGKK